MNLRLKPGWPVIGAVLFCAYSTILLWNGFQSERQLRAEADARLVTDSVRRAVPLSDLLLERQNDADDLAKSPEVANYLTNQALGMSPLYGLNSSLDAVEARFRRKQAEAMVHGETIYQRILFLDQTGAQVIDTAPNLPSVAVPEAGRVVVDFPHQQVLTQSQVWHNDILTGTILAVTSLRQLTQYLMAPDARAGYWEILLNDQGQVLSNGASPLELPAPVLDAALRAVPVAAVPLPPVDGVGKRVLIKVPVGGNGALSLVTIISADAAYGHITSRLFLYAASALPPIILLMAFMFEGMRRRNAKLSADFAASTRLSHELQDENVVLSDEIHRREVVEEELRQKSLQLEQLTLDLKESIRLAQAANRAKSDFLSNMSHELRTPLNAIIGFAELLLRAKTAPLTPRQGEQATHILKAGEYLLQLVNEILEFAKVEMGRIQVSIEPVNLRELIAECCNISAPLVEKHQVTLTDEIGDAPFTLLADRVRTMQILLNLISNAAKYNRPDGGIWLRCQPVAGNLLRLAVVDNGLGIDAAQQELLFEPFNRLGAENTEIEGTGIGLALSRKLTEMMAGQIGFTSLAGQGSTFWVDLPLDFSSVLQAEQMNTPSQPQPVAPDGAARLLLYIEDNPANVRLVEDYMAECDGWAVMVAHTAELGVALAQHHQPDLILCDINLPGMNGIRAVQELRQLPNIGQNVPILALSADVTAKTMAEGLQAGFNEYLTKPIRLAQLERMLAQAGESPAASP